MLRALRHALRALRFLLLSLDQGTFDPDGISARYARAEFPLKSEFP
jgi:hypothetical protein